MSKRKSTSAAAADTYDSDNGFVEDAPRGKKAKTKSGVVKTGKEKGKSAGAGMAGGGQVGKNGECFWEVCIHVVLGCLPLGEAGMNGGVREEKGRRMGIKRGGRGGRGGG